MLRIFEQHSQVLLPHRRDCVRAMAASLRARRDDEGGAALHAFDLALEDAELRWIDEIVSEVHRDEGRANAFEPGRRVLVPGCADLVEHVVRVLLAPCIRRVLGEHLVCLRECRHLLLPQQRIAAHEKDQRSGGAQ